MLYQFHAGATIELYIVCGWYSRWLVYFVGGGGIKTNLTILLQDFKFSINP